MSSMSYCRFENTVDDMRACLFDLQEAAENGLTFDQFLQQLSSDYERDSVRRMVALLQDMTEAFDNLEANN